MIHDLTHVVIWQNEAKFTRDTRLYHLGQSKWQWKMDGGITVFFGWFDKRLSVSERRSGRGVMDVNVFVI